MAKILIIDDEPTIRRFIRRCLESNGHDVSELADGYEASRIQSDTPVDLVITDMFMPGQDGLQTIMRLRDKDPNLPIIAMSGGAIGKGGMTRTVMLDSAKLLGAIQYLEKPFGIDRLHEVVAAALDR